MAGDLTVEMIVFMVDDVSDRLMWGEPWGMRENWLEMGKHELRSEAAARRREILLALQVVRRSMHCSRDIADRQ